MDRRRRCGDVQGADTRAHKNALRKDVLVVLSRDAGHHRAEDEKQGPNDHDWSRAVSVEQAADETSLRSGMLEALRDAMRVPAYREEEHPEL